jgi:hypothetical protein
MDSQCPAIRNYLAQLPLCLTCRTGHAHPAAAHRDIATALLVIQAELAEGHVVDARLWVASTRRLASKGWARLVQRQGRPLLAVIRGGKTG